VGQVRIQPVGGLNSTCITAHVEYPSGAGDKALGGPAGLEPDDIIPTARTWHDELNET
jgi:hypothetical protein